MRKSAYIICLLLLSSVLSAQIRRDDSTFVVPAVVVQGDTMPYYQLPEFEVISKRYFSSRREEIRYTRLVHNVRIVYPYARLAGETLTYYEDILAKETNEKKRNEIMKQAEKDITEQFQRELMRLTISQGKILIKLIDRETSKSSYNLVKELRGNMRAFFYQGIGRLFGYNLKTKYDPKGEDKDIEQIVLLLEQNKIYYQRKEYVPRELR